MSKRIVVWLFIAAVLLIPLSCRPADDDGGYIAYQAVDEDGDPAPEVVVLDASGKELRRIELPSDIGQLFPYRPSLSGHVLYNDAVVTGKWFLINVVSGELHEFDAFGQEQDMAQPCAASSGYVMLCAQQRIYLLDVQAGTVLDIPVELDPADPAPLTVELVHADTSTFLVRTTGDLWLVPATDPQDTRRLGRERRPLHAVLSDDGAFVVYAERTEEGETLIVKETIDGTESEILLSDADIRGVEFVPQHNQLVIVRRDAVSLYDLADGEERILFEPMQVYQALLSAQGEKAALSIRGADSGETTWSYVDLTEGTKEELDELEGYQRVHEPDAPRWLFLDDSNWQATEVHIASLDLETAKVRKQASLEDADRLDFVSMTKDGRVGLVQAISRQGDLQVWLLVAGQKDAVLLAEGKVGAVQAALSPAGNWVVLGERESDRPAMTIKLVPTGSGRKRTLGKGSMPVWARP